MHVTEEAVSKTFRLSRRVTVEITVGAGGLLCEWNDPTLPDRGLTRKEVRAYRAARDEMVGRLAERLGIRQVFVLEMPPTTQGEGG